MVLSRYHLDTDFLIYALEAPGSERERLLRLADSGAELAMSAAAWYEFSRGPRTPQQLAVARCFFPVDGILPVTEEIATLGAELFRSLGSPRRRGSDILIGITAVSQNATLLTHNPRDFAGIPGLDLA